MAGRTGAIRMQASFRMEKMDKQGGKEEGNENTEEK